MVKYILASQSPTRVALLKRIKGEFEVIVSNVDETQIPKSNPTTYVKRLAKLKAKAVAKMVDEGIIIGADTIALLDGNVIGKPKDKEDAINTLRQLSGKEHIALSGVCVINKYTGKTVTRVAKAKVKFRNLDDRVIIWYVGTGEPLGKAGSYAIQERGAMLIESVKGDPYAVAGLPISTISGILEGMGIFE